ncbi:MAG: AAA family ATPase [Gammaproteobacteria bacterium]|jgi:type II secretory pathway predicted ATPase ExeA|nr:general secretion pathway protein [Chromatiales bacterium]MDP6673244.1 AAA family ATPase [Gammaproteobacteria bacterium]
MYEQFFGLREKPFTILPDPSYLYMSKGHTKALTLLRYSIVGRQGFTVVTGEIGSGKTTLINRLLEDLDEDITVGLLNFTDPGATELNEWIGMAFGLDYAGKSRTELYEDFISFLIRQYAQGKYTVLIVDEAQNLVIKGLEKIRMLSNVNAQKEHLLHLILVGQPQLRDLLRSADLEQLVQRISVSYHLDRLSPRDSKAYVLHRLKVAGATEPLFSPQALRILVEASKGVPRIINTVCDLALVYGFSSGKRKIDARIAKAVLADREEMGLGVTGVDRDYRSGISSGA